MHPALRFAAVTAAVVLVAPSSSACAPDALRFCDAVLPNVARTTACLAAHRADLRATCRRVFVFAEHSARVHRHVRIARRAGPYHIPHFDQGEAEAEVHEIYPYRTPYPYPAVFGPW